MLYRGLRARSRNPKSPTAWFGCESTRLDVQLRMSRNAVLEKHFHNNDSPLSSPRRGSLPGRVANLTASKTANPETSPPSDPDVWSPARANTTLHAYTPGEGEPEISKLSLKEWPEDSKCGNSGAPLAEL